jgi:putative protease
MRGVFYVATVTKAYREAIVRYYEDPAGYRFDTVLYEDLSKTVHREFDTGFFFDRPGIDAKISYDDTYIRGAKVAGIVTEYDVSKGRAVIEQRNKISEGDRLEIVSPKGRHFTIKARDMEDMDGVRISATPHPRMLYSMAFRIPVVPGSFIRLVEDGKDLTEDPQ